MFDFGFQFPLAQYLADICSASGVSMVKSDAQRWIEMLTTRCEGLNNDLDYHLYSYLSMKKLGQFRLAEHGSEKLKYPKNGRGCQHPQT